MATEIKSKSDVQYQIEDGARTLIRAEEIKQDKKLYEACQKEMAKQMSALHRAMGESKGKSLMAALKEKEED